MLVGVAGVFMIQDCFKCLKTVYISSSFLTILIEEPHAIYRLVY